jgi:glycosyltransferase involved in cell wall biosynthesis
MTRRPRYLLVTPCRDEAAVARRCLDSIVGQSVTPDLWVIVDDGSSDETPAILAEYAERYPFIRILRREDRSERSVGPGVIEAFYAGYDSVDPTDFDYVAKVDLDLDLPAGYFENLMARMEAEPRLGTVSGKAYYQGADGRLISEACGDEMSVGMTKFYRRTCFEEVGGFVRAVMWDGIDCHRCRQLGWIACSWDDPELRFIHLRPMGSSHKGILTGRMRHGRGQWFMGTGLLYMTASAVFRMTRPPRLVGGLAMWWGFVSAALTGQARYPDPDFRRFLRRYQWRCLVLGKRRATAELDASRGAVWEQRATRIGA